MHTVPTDPAPRRIHDGLERLSAVLREEMWRAAWPAELSATQVQVLRRLAVHPGSTLREVAQALGVRDSTASEAVTTLESKGLLSKVADPADRRRRLLHPTVDAARLLEQSSSDGLLEVLETLPEPLLDSLVVGLQEIVRGLQVAGRIPIAGTCSTCRFFRPNAHDDPRRPHHCALVDAAFGPPDLRFDCPEHEPAAALA